MMESGTARLEEASALYNVVLKIFVTAKVDYHASHCRQMLDGLRAVLAERKI
jgi:hypothetical protein